MLKMFALFFVIFALAQAGIFAAAKALFPYQIIVDARGWVSQTSLLIFVEAIAMAFCAAVMCVLFVRHILGPIPRLIEEIKLMECADEHREIKVRTNDKLHLLVEALNSLLAKYLGKK
jgi:nitrogen fixation/metabolism regulation signal transduction histidine kinase